MTEEQIRKLLNRLLISFLAKQWHGRTHGGLADNFELLEYRVLDQDEIKAEVQRFVNQFVEL